MNAPAGGAGGNDRKPRQRRLVGSGKIGQIILLLIMRDKRNGFVNSHGGPSSGKPRQDRGFVVFNRFDTPIYSSYPDQTKATATMNFRGRHALDRSVDGPWNRQRYAPGQGKRCKGRCPDRRVVGVRAGNPGDRIGAQRHLGFRCRARRSNYHPAGRWQIGQLDFALLGLGLGIILLGLGRRPGLIA
jgi:hypothetical protein